MTMAGINLNRSKSQRHTYDNKSGNGSKNDNDDKYIKLNCDSRLVKDDDSDTYTISYDIIPSPVKRKVKLPSAKENKEESLAMPRIAEVDSTVENSLKSQKSKASLASIVSNSRNLPCSHSQSPTSRPRNKQSSSSLGKHQQSRSNNRNQQHSSSSRSHSPKSRKYSSSHNTTNAAGSRGALPAYKASQLKYSPSASKSMKKKALQLQQQQQPKKSQLQKLAETSSSTIPRPSSLLPPPVVKGSGDGKKRKSKSSSQMNHKIKANVSAKTGRTGKSMQNRISLRPKHVIYNGMSGSSGAAEKRFFV